MSTRAVRKNMRLDQDVLDRARKILGTRTETETVAQALELVAFRHEVVRGIRAIAGSGALRDVYEDG
jgi:Arc/MetJ family transcription regulator